MARKKKNQDIQPEKKKLTRTLGIDLSIGKIKLCLLTLDPDEKTIGGAWSSLPVKFEAVSEKNYEFSNGMVIAIEAFLQHHGTNPAEIDSIVFCTGGAYYMFPTFADGMRYSGGILKMIFPRQNIYFIRTDGAFIRLKDIFELDDFEASAFGCTNYLGTALLAAKLFPDGLAIDMGTISTSIIPILGGKIDPVAAHNPVGYMLHRYTTGKHVWYGVMHTQLNYITTRAKTGNARYNLILRSCTTNTLCSLLDLVEPEVANVHVQQDYSHISGKELAMMRLAETIGLDINSVSGIELMAVAQDIYQQFVEKLADIIRDILLNMTYPSFGDLKILAAGLGQEAFIIPALLKCGFAPDQILTISEQKQSNLWTAASVYGIALAALERLIKEEISVSFENPSLIT